MQSGLTNRRLSFRDIFMSLSTFLRLVRLICIFGHQESSTFRYNFVIRMAA